MSLLSLTNVHCAHGTHVVLGAATLSVEPGEKIGLVGRNGSGKTTLMRIMLGELAPDSGLRQVRRSATVGYLRQELRFDPQETVFDVAEGAFAQLHRVHHALNEVFEAMSSARGAELERLMSRQARLEAEMETAGGYAVSHRIEAALHGLGFTDEQFALRTAALSGGQLARLGLARLLLESPDLLLLDEPTNHLDIDGRRWLEEFLAEEYRGAVVLVSHDRWLLDRIVGRIVEVERGEVRSYPGNYSSFVGQRALHRLTEIRTYEKQLDRIRSEEAFIRRYRAGQRAKQARGRESRLERFVRDELMDRPVELDVLKLQLPEAQRSGDQVIVAQGLTKRYGDLVLFEDFDLAVTRGERIGIIGPNGVGKTTLVRCLLGETAPDRGTSRLGSQLRIGYYHQKPPELDATLAVWRYLQAVTVPFDGKGRVSEQQARDLAGAFLFSGNEQDKPISALSGGEMSRMRLAGLVAGAHNLLVLDEPTNHLDIPSAERLEQALAPESGWGHTLLVITHDRALLESLCERLIVFDGHGGVRLHPGRYSTLRAPAAPPPEATPAAPAAGAKPRPATPAKTARAGPHAALSLARIEAGIERLQAKIGAVDRQLLDPRVTSDGPRCRRLQAERSDLERQLEPLEAEWARRAE
jgi:ATP-binding cassette subfamily F protein 3